MNQSSLVDNPVALPPQTDWQSFVQSIVMIDVALWAAGLGLIVWGFFVMRKARPRLESTQPLARDRASGPALLVLAMSMVVAGYHLIVWGLPDHFTNLKVAAEYWYFLAATLGLLPAAAWGLDVLERRHREGLDSNQGGPS